MATVENNLRFAGQYYDSETGLHYNYHRYYDPSIGRYLTADPIGLAGGINLYSYAQNNPVNFTDPLGLWTFQIGFGINWGFGIGGSTSWGLAISSDPCTGEKQIGFYSTKGIGIEAGGVLEGAIDFTWSPNKSIEDLSGAGFTIGGSGGTPLAHLGFGGEASFPIDSAPSVTVSGTFGLSALGGEGHGFFTNTRVVPVGAVGRWTHQK